MILLGKLKMRRPLYAGFLFPTNGSRASFPLSTQLARDK